MEDELAVSGFLHRLGSLQRLCSGTDPNFPVGLLFVCGQDGRHNKGSISILKYLFFGSFGKELFDGIIETEFEVLEDLVILIQQSSVSIILTRAIRKKLEKYLKLIPFLIEYLPTEAEENEIDLLEARKCCDFKRMMIEAVGPSGGVGIPVPMGYDDVLDVESWPLIQSFAVDNVLCSSGFFTARYNVIDITDFLEILFRAVDTSYINQCLDTVQRTVLPHALQTMRMFDGSTADQRAKVTGEDALGPLSMLFEFGELHCAFPVDPSRGPFILFGEETNEIGDPLKSHIQDDEVLAEKQAGSAMHCVVEGFEPSCGIRWCRTYFLQRGKCLDFVVDIDSLTDRDVADKSETSPSHSVRVDNHAVSVSSQQRSAVHRLEALYAQLAHGLRSIVRHVFPKHFDVLEAAAEVQKELDTLMKGRRSVLGDSKDDIGIELCSLRTSERLTVHTDCLNALGEVVAIDDVDDMGGACWVYIRVSVSGIGVSDEDGNVQHVAVSVGDTFLFSTATEKDLALGGLVSTANSSTAVNAAILKAKGLKAPEPNATSAALILAGDNVCLTASLPYFFFLPGAGAVDKSAQRLLACSRNALMLPALGLGRSVDSAGTGLVRIPILTDHPLMPVSFCELRSFTTGFVIEKLFGSCACMPLLVSFEHHVEAVYTMDLGECFKQASTLMPHRPTGLPKVEAMEGLIVVLKLRSSEDFKNGNGRSSDLMSYGGQRFADDVKAKSGLTEDMENSIRAAMQCNPLERGLPDSVDESSHLALIIPADSLVSATMSEARLKWKEAMRLYDVKDIRGSTQPLPKSILKSFLACIDAFSMGLKNATENIDPIKANLAATSSASDPGMYLGASTVLSITHGAVASTMRGSTLGLGNLPLKCVHCVSESQRLRPVEQGEDMNMCEEKDADWVKVESTLTSKPQRRMMVAVVGHSASGAFQMGVQLRTRLSATMSPGGDGVSMAVFDLASASACPDAMDKGEKPAWREELTSKTEAMTNAISTGAKIVEQLDQDRRYSSSVQVVVAVIIVPSVFHARTVDVLSKVAVETASEVATVLSIADASTMTMPHHLTDQGSQSAACDATLGLETWKASSLETFQSGVSDFAIVTDAGHREAEFLTVRDRVDTSEGAGAAGQTMDGTIQRQCIVVRLISGQLRLDDESYEQLVSMLRSQRDCTLPCAPLGNRAEAVLRGGMKLEPAQESQSPGHTGDILARSSLSLTAQVIPVACPGLAAFNFGPNPKNASASEPWSLHALAMVLKCLFNKATSTVTQEDKWLIPQRLMNKIQGLPFWQRAVMFAKLKVLTAKKYEIVREECSKRLAAVKRDRGPELQQLQSRLRSVHGIVRIREDSQTIAIPLLEASADANKKRQAAVGGRRGSAIATPRTDSHAIATSAWAMIEACSGTIMIRNVADDAVNGDLSAAEGAYRKSGGKVQGSVAFDDLIVQGNLSNGDVSLLRHLLESCWSPMLEPKSPSKPEEFTKDDLKRLQKSYGADNLPKDCWFDGQFFIDFKGNRSELRPDVDEILSEHVEKKNIDTGKYNQLLEELREFL